MRTGVVLLGFGGPDSIESVGPFMRDLTGREPSREILARVRRNYEAIGGASPLAGIALRMAGRLEADLLARGKEIPVTVGMTYWHPFVAEAVARLAEDGCDCVVAVQLSPFESLAASEAGRRAFSAAAHASGIVRILEAPLVSTLGAFGGFFARQLSAALGEGVNAGRRLAVFSAHSLPLADLAENDPYVTGLRSAAAGIAAAAGLADATDAGIASLLPGRNAFGTEGGATPWLLAYQSKGARPGGWLEPSLGRVMEAAAASGAIDGLVVCPIGFLTDHMETLFDLDIEAAGKAARLGLAFRRVAVPNDDADVVSAIASAVERTIEKGA